MSFSIRLMERRDLKNIMEIEEESFIAKWNEQQFLYELFENPYNVILVAEIDDKVVGFIDFLITFNSSTISQIAVKKEFRKKGIANSLIEKMIEILKKQKDIVETSTLEVRTHNLKAVNLYKKFGYEIKHVKKGYYTNGDDAYYMVKVLI